MSISKIFNLSLPRCGTKSFHSFCRQKHLKSLHWLPQNPLNNSEYSLNDFNNLQSLCQEGIENNNFVKLYDYYNNKYFDEYECFSDLHFPLINNFLFRDYLDSTFLIFYRNVDDWIISLRNHLSNNEDNCMYSSDVALLHKLTGTMINDINDISASELKNGYYNYFNDIVNSSIQHKLNLHILHLESSRKNNMILNNLVRTEYEGYFGIYK